MEFVGEKSDKKEIEVKPKPKYFVCNFDECGASFTKKRGLNRHIALKHLNLKPHKCTKCSATFAKRNQLQKHIDRVHIKIKSFKCDKCTSAFFNGQRLKNHVKWVHEKEKHLKCSECPSTFSKNSHLKRHLKVVHEKSDKVENTFQKCETDGIQFMKSSESPKDNNDYKE